MAAASSYVMQVKNASFMARFTRYSTFSNSLAKNTFWAGAWGWYTVPVTMFAFPGYIMARYLERTSSNVCKSGCPYALGGGMGKTQTANRTSFINDYLFSVLSRSTDSPSVSGSSSSRKLTAEESENLYNQIVDFVEYVVNNEELMQKTEKIGSIDNYPILMGAVNDTEFMSRLGNKLVNLCNDYVARKKATATGMSANETATPTTNSETNTATVASTVVETKPEAL